MADHRYDVLIIGSGAAGLTAALNLADTLKVCVLAKGGLSEGSTAWAQGGIAAVLEPGDTFEAHVEDTMVAGAGLNDRRTVEFVVEHAPEAIERLAALGVPFNPGEGPASERWHLTREGGHSHRRIVHVDDATGWAVQEALAKAAAAHPHITLVTDMAAIDLATGRHALRYSGDGRVRGVYALHRPSGRVALFTARATILAHGGDLPDPGAVREWDESRVTDSDEDIVVQHNWREIRRFMWNYVGIVRTTKRLERALHRVTLLAQEVEDYYGNYRITADLIELRNLVVVAGLIVRSALQRHESRGLHYTLDYPNTLPAAVDTVLVP